MNLLKPSIKLFKPIRTLHTSTYIKLIEAKDRKSLTFSQIANQLQRTENWTASVFYGKIQPDLKELRALGEVLNLSNQELLIDSKKSQWDLPKVISKILQEEPCTKTLITVQGWVKTIRNQKHISFIELIDGSSSTHLQIILNPNQSQGIETGSSIKVIGHLVKSKGSKQGIELKCESIKLIGKCSVDHYPLQKKTHSISFLRQHSHLRPRTTLTAALLRLRSRMSDEASRYLNSLDFFKTEPPIITFNDCEGAGEVFRIQTDKSSLINPTSSTTKDLKPIEFFNQPAYLTVSTQLHLEAFSSGLGRVYTLGPCFRAETSQTNRHLAEFWMLEVEFSFCEDLEDVMKLVENLLKSIIYEVKEELESVYKAQDLQNDHLIGIDQSWPRISYTEVIQLMKSIKEDDEIGNRLSKVEWGESLGSEHEKWISGSYFKSPVFITHYPKKLKPFYMLKDQNDQTVSCFDLIVPGIGELVGGSLREFKEERLLKNLKEKRIELDEKLDWYVDLRRFGTQSHGGFGIGWDRFVCWISGVENVREVIGFPRSVGMKNI
ncbi:hypothetical protein DFH28DRAFT_1064249 [Melampsora americana]|nr:hypothetical protein DFH28DRAFT_1064249 [Melampsora americana]